VRPCPPWSDGARGGRLDQQHQNPQQRQQGSYVSCVFHGGPFNLSGLHCQRSGRSSVEGIQESVSGSHSRVGALSNGLEMLYCEGCQQLDSVVCSVGEKVEQLEQVCDKVATCSSGPNLLVYRS